MYLTLETYPIPEKMLIGHFQRSKEFALLDPEEGIHIVSGNN